MKVADVDSIVLPLASAFYSDYPDPMPELQYLGGHQGQGLLESALSNPAQSFAGRYVYRTTHEKAASLLWSVIKNHPFVDGNKRMGLMATFLFLALNDYLLYAPQKDAVEICLRVAGAGNPIAKREVRRWIRHHSISFGKLLAMDEPELTDWLRDNTSGQDWPGILQSLRVIASLPG